MMYVGLDAHLRRSTFHVVDSEGNKVMSRLVKGSTTKVLEELSKVKEELKRPLAVCLEASCASGHLHDQLMKIADRVVVAHPGRLRLIFMSKRKSDRIDAERLAFLLRINEVPPVYVPGTDVRSWRKMIESRMRFVDDRTRVKNRIRSLLHSLGIKAPGALWKRSGLDWLSQLELPEEMSSLQLSMLVSELKSLNGQVRLHERALARVARKHPAVRLLMTIPGIGIRTAECLVAYIDDPRRFSGKGKVASYFGLVPRLDSSAGKDRLGHITKQGPPTARRLLTEAAWLGVRKSELVRSYYQRIMNGDPDRKKIAIIATAHYLLRVSLAMMKTGECWREAG